MTGRSGRTLPPLAWLDAAGMPPARLVLVVAHPDDETLVAGALLHEAGARGLPSVVLVASAGEASHPESPTHSPAAMAQRRRAELAAAIRALHPGCSWRILDLPDGHLAEHEPALIELIGASVDPSCLVVSTWRHDGHPDHEAVGRATAHACASVGARHVEAPLWAWFWRGQDGIPWDAAVRQPASPAALHAKRAAISAHVSQVQPLSEHPADSAVLAPDVLDHFTGCDEVFLEHPVTPPAAQVFDALYDRGPDPWAFAGSWYEQRKRALTLASLPQQQLGRVLEIGPADGLLTVDLAERSTSLVGLDVSPRAIAAAQQRCAAAGLADRVELLVGEVPRDLPDRPVDTVVVSEVAYFLSAQQWATTLHRLVANLDPEGCLVLVHWMHPITGWPMSGESAHDLAVTFTGLTTTVHHVESDFELRVLEHPGRPTLATREGRR